MTGADARQATKPPTLDPRFDVPLRGVGVDAETRCAHYDGPLDVVAIRFACCDVYHPCAECHHKTADHEPVRWPTARFDEPAVLCGTCRTTLTVRAYLDSGASCPACGVGFNPRCALHHDLYFESA